MYLGGLKPLSLLDCIAALEALRHPKALAFKFLPDLKLEHARLLFGMKLPFVENGRH
jgi:hypothetical protein